MISRTSQPICFTKASRVPAVVRNTSSPLRAEVVDTVAVATGARADARTFTAAGYAIADLVLGAVEACTAPETRAARALVGAAQ